MERTPNIQKNSSNTPLQEFYLQREIIHQNFATITVRDYCDSKNYIMFIRVAMQVTYN
jgi:hypothetical protein